MSKNKTMTINNRNCKVDFTTNRIFVSRKFLENSQKIYSEEFRTMIELQKIAAEQIVALIADRPLSYEDEFYDEREEIRWQYRSAAWVDEYYYAYGIH